MMAWVALTAMVWAAVDVARRVDARLQPDRGGIDRAIRIAILALAIVVACGLVLGTAGRFTLRAMLAVQIALLVVVWRSWRTRTTTSASPPVPNASPSPTGLPAVPLAIVGGLLAFGLAFAATHAPFTLYDSLSYHLFFAARWVQDHFISIIPTPFSDEAQAYAPANGELFLAWLMLPFHSDAVARAGQLPFGLLGALVLFGLARRLGAPAQRAIYPSVFFLMSRSVLEQMVGANVDLICAALFLTTIVFIVEAVERDRPADWAIVGVGLGLFLGSKYVALVYAPVLVLLAHARGTRRRALWALPTAVAFGLPWYLRNWLVAGSPIYPADLTIAGITIAHGAFDRAAMFNTVFHTSDPRLFPVIVARLFGPPLAAVWLPCAIVGWIAMSRRGWWPHGTLVLVPIAMVPMFWYGLPVNIDPRFLMPALAPSLLPLAFVFSSSRAWNTAVHGFYTGAMIWLITGAQTTVPAAVPWYMNGWLALNGLVARDYLPWFIGVVLAMLAVWQLARSIPRLAPPLAAAALLMAAGGLTLAANRVCAPACGLLDTTSPFIRDDYVEAWRWIEDNLRDSTVAYTGINLPYPLTGDRLTNRVIYVAIDGRSRWRLHDYDHAYHSGRFDPRPPLLAISSGELKPVAVRSGPREDAIRPRYERMQGNYDAWIFGLERFDVRYLFVAAMSMYEVDYVWHNDGGFPVEDEWAKSTPGRFQTVFKNRRVHIYEFGRGAAAS